MRQTKAVRASADGEAAQSAHDRPWYAMWARDWLSSAAIGAMKPEQEGAYVRLLNLAWLAEPPCTITSDDNALAQLSRLGRRWRTLGPLVKEQFELVDNGRKMRNRRQYGVFCEMVEQHAKRRQAGSKGGHANAARQRAPSNATAMLEQCSSKDVARLYHADADTDGTAFLDTRARENGSVPEAQEPEGFSAAWAAYPRRAGGNPKRKAASSYRARLRDGARAADLLAGVERYRQYCEATGKVGTEFVMQAARFFGPDRSYEDAWEVGAHAGAAADDEATRLWRVLRSDGLLRATSAEEVRAAVDRHVADGRIENAQHFVQQYARLDIQLLRTARDDRAAIQHIRDRLAGSDER